VTDVLYVKGSGSDLATIAPGDFPACRLAHLKRCCERATMTDEEMVAQLRGQMIDPSSPTPSVEALLHAYLPAKFVDHTHADAVLAAVDQPGSSEIVEQIWGGRALFIPYVMPGFLLARRVAELWSKRMQSGAEPELMILDKHGIFTWGRTAEESYERMIRGVRDAENYLADGPGPRSRRTLSCASPDQYETIAPVVRGALQRASGKRWITTWRTTPAMLAFCDRDDLVEVSQVGCATPDHVLRTKATPLVIQGADGASLTLRSKVDSAIARYAESYHDTFQLSCAARKTRKTELDRMPRVLLFPGLGALTVGASRRDAEIAADVYEHTAGVIEAATAMRGYEPVSSLDLFDVEYWSLEQAKLKRAKGNEGPLVGRVALVTGAASGIGLATVGAMLAAGAHVVATDRDSKALDTALEALEAEHGVRLAKAVCDVMDEKACHRAMGTAAVTFGGVDIVVSNAGAAFQGALHTASGDHALRASLELNLMGHQNVARAAASVMVAQGTGGALLFNASKSAFNQGPDFGPYAVAKAALVALAKQYAVDLAGQGIRANAVNADRVRTGIFADGVVEQRAKARGVPVDEYFRANLLKRETTAADVAAAFVYLATAEATTGCVITVDGGNAAAFPR
jgi:rhamnose utilization protein RhaD (predicted bifunctional aldolase and dehydrogenase)/NAD(P)-dependent dehydrogenase (short-subunit alcohol dehydrogenase family)